MIGGCIVTLWVSGVGLRRFNDMVGDNDNDNDVGVRLMRPADASSVARLHEQEIDFGFISTLGRRFLTTLYAAMLESGEVVIFVAQVEGRVIGFCAVTPDVSKMYKAVMHKRWWKLGLVLLPRVFSLKVIKHCYETLRYPNREDTAELPEAELVSMAVDNEWTGRGVGKLVARHAIQSVDDLGVSCLRVAVLESTVGANRFYQTIGFEFHSEIMNHGRALNIYTLDPRKRT
jgi:ribosomal protein S18 acetylase RimI-like enzyme